MKGSARTEIIAFVGVLVAIVAAIAAWLVVPEFRQAVGLQSPATPSTTPSVTHTPTATTIPTTLIPTLSPTPTNTPTSTARLTPTFTPTATSTPSPTPTPTPCFCQAATDEEMLRCLIDSESEAANNDDLTLIQRIFAPHATILRGDTEPRQEWDDPLAYYKPAFDSLDFTEARHFDHTKIEITAQIARYTSGSSGFYATPNGTPTPYYNPNPSEHWTFGKNDAGCWIIARFEFNAMHIAFP